MSDNTGQNAPITGGNNSNDPATQGGNSAPNIAPAGVNANQSNSNDPNNQSNVQNTPNNIPYGRFSEEVAKRKSLETKLSEIEVSTEKNRQEKLVKDGEFQKLLEEQAPKVERAKILQGVVEKTVKSLMDRIPEEKQKLIPQSLSAEDQLDYINQNLAFFSDNSSKNINTGLSPNGQTPASNTFTNEQLKDSKFYEENKVEIEQARKEGRLKG